MKKRRNHRASTVDRLPREIHDRITALASDGATIAEIIEHLSGCSGVPKISWSALQRYLQRWRSDAQLVALQALASEVPALTKAIRELSLLLRNNTRRTF
jgi:hypothetical protein